MGRGSSDTWGLWEGGRGGSMLSWEPGCLGSLGGFGAGGCEQGPGCLGSLTGEWGCRRFWHKVSISCPLPGLGPKQKVEEQLLGVELGLLDRTAQTPGFPA